MNNYQVQKLEELLKLMRVEDVIVVGETGSIEEGSMDTGI